MENEQRDYVAIAKDYAKRAANKKNRKQFGIWMRFAAQRFIDDIARAREGRVDMAQFIKSWVFLLPWYLFGTQ